jgi:uridine kinase
VADRITAMGGCRVRVAIDGLTGAGKTTFGHELAVVLANQGRVVARASLDDFKRPWHESHLYDRVSGEGYYRNAFDLDAIHRLLLKPARSDGTGAVALCAIDPITQIDHSTALVALTTDAVLLVDGVFAMRSELVDEWDLRIWLSVNAELSVRRGVDRDTPSDVERQRTEALHRERYLAAEIIYIDEVNPSAQADVIIDNTNIDEPTLIRI